MSDVIELPSAAEEPVQSYQQRREIIDLILDGVDRGVHLYERHRPTWGELGERQAKRGKHAMLGRPPATQQIIQGFIRLLEIHMENGAEAKASDDEAGIAEAAEGILFVMLEAERIGAAWWDGDEWQWR